MTKSPSVLGLFNTESSFNFKVLSSMASLWRNDKTEELSPARRLLNKGQRDRDPSLLKQAAELFSQSVDPEGEADCYAGLGEMRFSANSFHESTEWYQKGLEIYSSLGKKKGEAECLFFLSKCCAFISKENKTRDETKYLKAALAAAEEADEQELQVECCISLGACLRVTEPEESRKHYHNALQISEQMEKGWLSGICHQSLAHLYAWQSEDIKARKHYLAAIENFELAREEQEKNTDLRQAQCLESLADLALREGDEDEAQERYQLALTKLESQGITGTQRVREKLARIGQDE